MIDDAELLRRYAENRSEDAFTELVRRHLNIVYGAALRRSGGDAHRAADVAQLVFTELARQASVLKAHTGLTGWLYATTRNKAIDTIRSEQRRQNRELEAQIMHEPSSPGAVDVDWNRLKPVLDDVLDDLNDDDREAVLLRFFQELSFSEIGATLQVSEDAARMRVSRSLDKLRAALSRRGVTSTTAALTVALAGQVGMAAPTGLVATVATAALTGAAVVGGGTAAIAFVSLSKLSAGIATVILVAGTVGLVREYAVNANLRTEISALHQQDEEFSRLRAEHELLVKKQAANQEEITRIRGENEILRKEVQVSQASARKTASGGDLTKKALTASGKGPGQPASNLTQSVLESRYATLARRLAFTPAQWDSFRGFLAAKQTVAKDVLVAQLEQGLSPTRNLRTIRDAVLAAQSVVNDQFKEEFGEAALKEYQQYEQLLPEQNTVDKFALRLRSSSSPLSEGQNGQLVQILAQTHEPEGNGSIGRILNGNINFHSKISDRTIQAAKGVLNEVQIAELQLLQQQQLGKFDPEDGT